MPLFKKNSDPSSQNVGPKPAGKGAEKNKLFSLQDFIPYACHYSPHTLLTKNGELCQTIKISDVNIGANDDVRMTIRQAMDKYIDPLHFAVWVHLVHDKVEEGTTTAPEDADPITKWDAKVRDNKKYHNALYITIIHDGQTYKLSNPANFIRNFSLSRLSEYKNNHLENYKNELENVVNSFLEELHEYKPRKLSVVKDESTGKEVLYSEPLAFLHKILTMEDKSIQLRRGDYSNKLVNNTNFYPYPGFIEFKTSKGQKRYASVITIKEFYINKPYVLNKILTLDFEYVVCHSIEFSKSYQELEAIRKQKYYNTLSGDKELARTLADDFEPNIRNIGMEQISFLIFADNTEELEQKNHMINDRLSEIGISFVHEDIKMEHCFWAMLPGNFNFLRRQHVTAKKNAFGLASLGSDISGRMQGKWGEYACAFETTENHIYYFNYFDKTEVGHTLIVADDYFSKVPLANFLAANSAKYDAKLFYISEVDYSTQLQKRFPSLDCEYLPMPSLEKLYENYNYILGNTKTDRKVVILINLPNDTKERNGYSQSLKEFMKELEGDKYIIIATCTDEYDLKATNCLNFFVNQFYSEDFELFENLEHHFELIEDEIFEIDKMDIHQFFLRQQNQDAVIKFDPTSSAEMAELFDVEIFEGNQNMQKSKEFNAKLGESFAYHKEDEDDESILDIMKNTDKDNQED